MQFLKEFMFLESIVWLTSPFQGDTIRFVKKFCFAGFFGTHRSPPIVYLFLYAPAKFQKIPILMWPYQLATLPKKL